MPSTILEEIEENLARVRRKVISVLDLAKIPDEHRLSEKAVKAFVILGEVLSQVPNVDRRVASVEGPLVYPVEGKDPLDWPTSEGVSVRAFFEKDSRYAKIASKSGIRVAKNIESKRVISYKEYLEALEGSVGNERKACQVGITLKDQNDGSTLVDLV